MLILTVEVMRVPGAPEEAILLQGGSAPKKRHMLSGKMKSICYNEGTATGKRAFKVASVGRKSRQDKYSQKQKTNMNTLDPKSGQP